MNKNGSKRKRSNKINSKYKMCLGLLAIATIVVLFYIVIESKSIKQSLNNSVSITYVDRNGEELLTVKENHLPLKSIEKKQLEPLINGEKAARNYLVQKMYGTEAVDVRTKMKASIARLYLSLFLSEQHLFQAYLNKLTFANGIIGLGTAADFYFQKKVNELDDLEWSYLIALARIQQNEKIDEKNEQVQPFMEDVLTTYANDGLLTQPELKERREEIPDFLNKLLNHRYAFSYSYLDFAVDEINATAGLTQQHDKVKVYLNMDSSVQKTMFNEFRNDGNFPENPSPNNRLESSMVLIDHKTGDVVAIMGNRNPFAKVLNRADHPRQPASTMKPLAVFGPALEQGWKEDDLLRDEPLQIGVFKPVNSDYKYRKTVSVEEAITKSYNVPAVWLLQQIGLNTGLDYLKKTNLFNLDVRDDYQVALGYLRNGASPMEMVKAYGAISNHGELVVGGAVRKVVASGEVLFEAQDLKSVSVFSKKTGDKLVELLTNVVEKGTGKSAAIEGKHVYGKTGTTSKDGWFIGSIENFTAAVWIGTERIDEKVDQEVSGGAHPAALFSKVMAKVHE